MPEQQPYTDEDLRVEATTALNALGALPSVPDIIRSLPGMYVDSQHRGDDEGPTWGDVLDEQGIADAATKVSGLVEGAADVSEWAVNLGADGLEPSDDHAITVQGDSRPIARIHFAFEPDMPEDMRTSLVEGIGQAINAAL